MFTTHGVPFIRWVPILHVLGKTLRFVCGWEFSTQMFQKMADRQRGAGLSPLAALEREISKMCKPFRPTQYVSEGESATYPSPQILITMMC